MPPTKSLRNRVHFILEVDRFGDRLSRAVDRGLIFLIVANVVVAILQTVPEIYGSAPAAFDAFETLSIAVFGVEYLLRVWSCVEDASFQRPISGRIRFALQPMMLLDLAVLVVPVYLDLRPLRILRLLRLGRYSPRLRLLARVVREKGDELLIGLMVAVVMLVACSTAMYYVERGHENSFDSIPEAMWWGVATLTTVGYGDVYPLTTLGKILGAMVALLGVGLFALPAGILASGFGEAIDRDRKMRQKAAAAAAEPEEPRSGGTCPHCGASI
jgi:voltage-gated potassium channel